MKSNVSIIAAIGKNRELGKDNKLLWNIPEDLKRFKDITNGHPIIMGRKTFESIGRVLPNRLNVVITRDPHFKVEGVVVVHSLQEAIEESSKYHVAGSKYRKEQSTNYNLQTTGNEVFIIGGGQIFSQAINLADKLYLTVVDKDYPDADAYFPEYNQFSVVESKKESFYDGLSYTFLDLQKGL